MEDNEGSRVASRESRDGLKHTVLGAGCFPMIKLSRCVEQLRMQDLRSIPSQEMVASLLWGELANRGKHAEGITSQHDDIAWLRVDDTRDLRIRDEFDGVRAASVLCNADVVVVGDTGDGVVDDVLEDRAVADGVEDVGFLLCGKVDALGVASAFNVENTRVGPDVFVVAN